MKFALCLAVSSLVYLVGFSSSAEEDVITTEVPGIGKVKGDVNTAANGDKYISYVDIPYGRIREKDWFQPAEPVPASEDVVNPSPAYACPSWEKTSLDKEEDFRKCLVLKVDSKDTTEKRPVIVFIPGLELGSGSTYSIYGKHIMAKDVVLVTVQYRLGAFGFLSASTKDLPGNIGVLDVIDALKWIQKYISYFGGDPNRVTLNGEYKAAGMIGVLTASPLAEGLFHQVIYQSGSIDLPYLVEENPLLLSGKVAHELGCTDVTDKDKVTECVLKAYYEDIMKAYNKVLGEFYGNLHPITVGGPSGVYNWKNQPRKYPTLGGFVDQPSIYLLEEYNNKSEPTRFSQEYYAKHHPTEWDRLKCDKVEMSKISKELYAEVALEEEFNVTDIFLNALIKAQIAYEIDTTALPIKLNVIRSLLNNIKLGGKSYLYVFKFKGGSHQYYTPDDSVLKSFVTMGDDTRYIYSIEDFNKEEKYVSSLMVDLWTSFAATGIPSSPMIYQWPELISPAGPYLIVDRTVCVGVNVTTEFTPTITCQKAKGCNWIEF